MGQYYYAVILANKVDESDEEMIRTYVHPHMYGNGAKLMEHSYVGNEFVLVVENLLGPQGMFYKSRLVWAGDYADKESDSDSDINLYEMSHSRPTFKHEGEYVSYPYIVNHTKKEYVVKKGMVHPLPLLTAEGNGRGGGDYYGKYEDLIGIWARDVLSMENEVPIGYSVLECNFKDYD